jgi:hypothetical protein
VLRRVRQQRDDPGALQGHGQLALVPAQVPVLRRGSILARSER